jgi:hypothetical protein
MLTKQQLQEKIVRLQILEAELSSGNSASVRVQRSETKERLEGCLQSLMTQVDPRLDTSLDTGTLTYTVSNGGKLTIQLDANNKLVNILPDTSYMGMMTGNSVDESLKAMKLLTLLKTAIQNNTPAIRTMEALSVQMMELNSGRSDAQRELDELTRVIGKHKAYMTAFGQVSPSVAYKMVRYMSQEEVKSLLEVFGLEYREHGGKKWLREAIREIDPTIAEEDIVLSV